MNIAAFLPYNVELVKKENALARACMLEHLADALGGFTKITPNDCFVPDHKEWSVQLVCYRLRE
jgi:hypothetical protein